MDPATRPLSRQERFIREFIVDLNATQAAIRASYAPKSAHVTAARLLRNAKVQAAIARERELQQDRLQIDADRVLLELQRVALANMEDFTEVVDGERVLRLDRCDRAHMAAIAELTVDRYIEGHGEDAVMVKRTKMRLHSKLTALHKLGEHLGLFQKKVEVSGEITLAELVAGSYRREEAEKAAQAKEKPAPEGTG